MFGIYRYDRELIEDCSGICDGPGDDIQPFDGPYSDIYAVFEALREGTGDTGERADICPARTNAAPATGCWQPSGTGPFSGGADYLLADDIDDPGLPWNQLPR